MCKTMGLNHYAITQGNNKAIIAKNSHRYVNKAQRIHAENCESFQDWFLGIVFALYGWNSSPTNVINVIRNYAATGNEFPFSIDFQNETDSRDLLTQA